MQKFKVFYTFDGVGNCEVEAENEQEAEELFFDGEFDNDYQSGSDYKVSRVEKI